MSDALPAADDRERSAGTGPVRVYLGYSRSDDAGGDGRTDRQLAMALIDQLAGAVERKQIVVFHKDNLLGDPDPARTLEKERARAEIIVLLITSVFVREEQDDLGFAKVQHKKGRAVGIGVLAKPYEDAALGGLRALPAGSSRKAVTEAPNQARALADIADAIVKEAQRRRGAAPRRKKVEALGAALGSLAVCAVVCLAWAKPPPPARCPFPLRNPATMTATDKIRTPAPLCQAGRPGRGTEAVAKMSEAEKKANAEACRRTVNAAGVVDVSLGTGWWWNRPGVEMRWDARDGECTCDLQPLPQACRQAS